MFNKKKEIVEPNLYDEVIDNKDGKSILATKIVKYAGIGLLGVAISLGSAFCITEAKTDHTREVCPLCVIGMELDINNDAGLNIGIEHQIGEMQEEYKEQGIDAEVYYEEDYIKTSEYTEYINAYKKEIDGVVTYYVPAGYELSGSKGIRTVVGREYIGPAIVTNIENSATEENVVQYVAPEGYTLKQGANGTYYCERIKEENPITHIKDGEITYVAPAGYVLEKRGDSYVCVKKEIIEPITITEEVVETTEDEYVLKLNR